jgi:hypothetical protein
MDTAVSERIENVIKDYRIDENELRLLFVYLTEGLDDARKSPGWGLSSKTAGFLIEGFLERFSRRQVFEKDLLLYLQEKYAATT